MHWPDKWFLVWSVTKIKLTTIVSPSYVLHQQLLVLLSQKLCVIDHNAGKVVIFTDAIMVITTQSIMTRNMSRSVNQVWMNS